MRGNEVADEQEDAHDDMLGDGHDVRARDLEHLDTPLDGRIEVDVVRADASSDGDLELLGLGQALGGEITGVEAVGDKR